MESSADADLNFGDVVRCVHAMEQALQITLITPTHTSADRIRHHVACIKRELEELASLAGDDKLISTDVESFAIKTIANLVRMIEASVGNLPHRAVQEGPPVCVEVHGEQGEPSPHDNAKRVRRAGRKVLSGS